ncbi:MAG TPA: hypothetical protein VGD76_01030, partial [Ramlibacter sp.]
MVVGSYQQRQAKKKQREAYNAAQVDRLANVVTTSPPRELVLGRVRKGGSVAFRGSTGDYKHRFIVAINLAAHEIDAVEQIYFNDQAVTLDSLLRVTDSPYYRLEKSGKIVITTTENFFARVWWHYGDANSIADPQVKVSFPDLWTDSHRGEGIAKLFVEFIYDETAFPNGMPTVTALIRGAKVYDPRDGVTRWTENPALLARHVYQHEHFGKATITAAEDLRFIAAANACDTSQLWTGSDGSTATHALYRAGLVAVYGSPAAPILDDLTQAMAGMWAFAGGELYIRAGVYTAPVMTFTDSDLAVVQRKGDQEQQEPLSISVHRERAEKFNVVNLRIWDSGQAYKQVGLTPLKGTALITRDGEELAQEMSLPAVSYAPQALHIAGVMMRDARDPLTIEVPLKMSAYAVELFDTIELAFERYGWDASPKEFIVLGRVWDHEKGVIRITGKETTAAIFNPDASFEVQGYAQNTALPNPWEVDPPGTLSVSSGTDELLVGADGTVITRARVSWPAIADPRVSQSGQVEVQWARADTDGGWNSILVHGSASEAFISGISDGLQIVVWARCRTGLATSDWGEQQSHTVAGKTEPPSAPTGVSVTQALVFFRAPSDADLAGIRIRSLAGIVAAPVFSRGTDVIDGLVLTSPARIERRLYGLQTVVVVAEDTSGNQSDPAYATLDFGQPDIDSAIWDHSYGALSFPGTYTACTLSGGQVLADAEASSDVYALDNLYGEPDVYATVYQAMTWQADAIVTPYAGVLALTDEIAGNAPVVEYRVGADMLSDLYASSDVYAEADLYGSPSEWSLWPGSLQVQRLLPIEFRVSTSASSEQGSISTFTLSLVMEEVSQTFANVTVDAAGTRMDPASGSPARNWVGALRAVYGWPAVDGSGAIAGRVLDFSPEQGPL